MRRRLAGLATAGALALGALAAPGAQAEPVETQGSTATQGSPHVAGLTVHPEWGSIAVPSGKLRKGCKTYAYSYALSPPEGDWAVEVFVTGPNGEAVWSGVFVDGSDQLSGPGSFSFCRQATTSGTFLLEAKMSVQNGPGEANYSEGQLPPVSFTLVESAKKKRDSYIVPCC